MSERLGSLQIIEEASERITKYTMEMSTVPVPTQENNKQARVLKNMIPNPGWFNRGKTKFEDWWRKIRLFLKSNKIIKTDDRIMTILACLREGIAGIYT